MNKIILHVFVRVLVCVAILTVAGATKISGIEPGYVNRNHDWDYAMEDEEYDVSTSGFRDVLIVDPVNYLTYYGWYQAHRMTPPDSYPKFWTLFQRTIDWSVNFQIPSNTYIALFTYDGNCSPPFDHICEEPQWAVLDYLINAGYNVDEYHQSDVQSLDVTGYDLAVYWNRYAYDCTNILNQNKPFITIAKNHTPTMNIGTGIVTMHRQIDTYFIINNEFHPTSVYPVGMLVFEGTFWSYATEATGNGIALATGFPETYDLSGNLNLQSEFHLDSCNEILIEGDELHVGGEGLDMTLEGTISCQLLSSLSSEEPFTAYRGYLLDWSRFTFTFNGFLQCCETVFVSGVFSCLVDTLELEFVSAKGIAQGPSFSFFVPSLNDTFETRPWTITLDPDVQPNVELDLTVDTLSVTGTVGILFDSPNLRLSDGTASGVPIPMIETLQGVLISTFVYGDANADRIISIADVVYLVNYLFKNGSLPWPLLAGDVDCNGTIDVTDAVYLVNYLFKDGPSPCGT